MDTHWLQSEIARRQIINGRDESLRTLLESLQAWHAGQGTRGATTIAVRQTYLGQLLGEGFTEHEAADRLGVPLRTVERDVAELKLVYAPARRSSAPAEPPAGTPGPPEADRAA